MVKLCVSMLHGLVAVAALVACTDARASKSAIVPKQRVSNLNKASTSSTLVPTWNSVPRGGAAAKEDVVTSEGFGMVSSALQDLKTYIKGTKSDALLLLLTTALIPPVSNAFGMSPILGFLANGVFCGPNGFALVQDVHATEALADLGIVLFLFEMGIHLNFDTLMSMRKDVFGLGLSQFALTAIAVAYAAKLSGQSTAAIVVLGGGLALSSSAFVLQLLKDKNQLSTDFGKSSFGVLLLQDLMVVPLLVVIPLLAGGGGDGLAEALGSAAVKTTMALAGIAFTGKFLLNPFFDLVTKKYSQEAFLGAILLTVLSMSFLTEGLGLSNTLGAFLAGVLLSETKYRHQIETEISPFRGILVGLFFFTVGFEIDLKLIASQPGLVFSIVAGIVVAKAVIATLVCLVFDKGMAISQQAGLILSQGGEFAFVAFRMAREYGILSDDITKLMLTCVSLTMGVTPFLEDMGERIANKLNADSDKMKSDSNKTKKVR